MDFTWRCVKMSLFELLSEIEGIVLPFLEREGIELVELKAEGVGGSTVLRFVVWKKGGIGIAEISRVSRHIGDLLDESDFIPGRYTMEVSSPGLDRKLVTSEDFRRAGGEKVRVELEDGASVIGEVVSTENNELVLLNGEEQRKIPFGEVFGGKIIIEF